MKKTIKQIALTFEDDSDIIISELAGEICFRFSFTSESLFITKKELSELIKTLQDFEEQNKWKNQLKNN